MEDKGISVMIKVKHLSTFTLLRVRDSKTRSVVHPRTVNTDLSHLPSRIGGVVFDSNPITPFSTFHFTTLL